MAKHCVIKYEYDDGVKMKRPIVWCGSEKRDTWLFKGAGHAALSMEQGKLVEPCRKCCKEIIKALHGVENASDV